MGGTEAALTIEPQDLTSGGSPTGWLLPSNHIGPVLPGLPRC